MYGFAMVMQVISHIYKIKNLLKDWPILVRVLKAEQEVSFDFLG